MWNSYVTSVHYKTYLLDFEILNSGKLTQILTLILILSLT